MYCQGRSVSGSGPATPVKQSARPSSRATSCPSLSLRAEIAPSGYGARMDDGGYPRPRSFTIGVNFQF